MKNKYNLQQILFMLSLIKNNDTCVKSEGEKIFNISEGWCDGYTVKECPLYSRDKRKSCGKISLKQIENILETIPPEDLFEAKLVMSDGK